MARAIPFGKLQKIWALICGDAIFLLFLVSLADVDRLFCNSLSRNVAFKSLMFMPEISNRMVFVNGKQPRDSRERSSQTRGLFLESPANFTGPKSQLSNFNLLVLKSGSFDMFLM